MLRRILPKARCIFRSRRHNVEIRCAATASLINNSRINKITIDTNQNCNVHFCRGFSTLTSDEEIDSNTFEDYCEETLDHLCEYFEELIESTPHLNEADVSYASGVLTVNFGKQYGIYVINRQSPNKQIWLSSPTSGPKRYDYCNNTWIYKHNNCSIYSLLEEEITKIAKTKIDLSRCAHYKS